MNFVRRPPLLILVAVLVGVEALGASAYAIWFGAQFFVAHIESLAGALFLLALFVLCAVWLWALTIGLLRMRVWTRAGTLVWQTIQAVVGFSMVGAEGAWPAIAVGMIALAVAVGVLLFTRPVAAVTTRTRD